MAGINTKLDANQVLKQAYDEPNQRLRVDATLTASIGDVIIKDADGDEMAVNPDGSINAVLAGGALQVEISAADGDNIAISDGTNSVIVNPDGSLNTTVTATDLDIRNLAFATDKVDVSGSSVSISNTDLDIRDLDASQDNVAISDGTDQLEINNDGSINIQAAALPLPTGAATETTLSNINNKLPSLGPQTEANSISVTLASDIGPLAVDVDLNAFTNTNPDSVQLVGSIDGTATGTKYGIVNNLRMQILDSQDRVADFTYADFGTKNQRITQINYTSSTFPSSTVQRIFSYTLIGNNYRRDSETWSIV